MGGRGTVSIGGGNVINTGSLFGGSNDIKNVGGETDPRGDIHTMFESEIGFSDVRGLENLNTATLGAQGIALNNLEREYGALKSIDRPVPVLGMDSSHVIAAVSYDRDGNPTGLLLNRKDFESVSKMNEYQRQAEANGWSMPTNGSVAALARYTVTHEYGHLMQTALWKKERAAGSTISEGWHAFGVKSDILKLAQSKYKATGSEISRYGKTNSYEFFAEAFANANSGKPNPIGLATRDYLRQHRL